ncbi:MAG: uracil-DNA glycosylase [Bacteroidota bacterium]
MSSDREQFELLLSNVRTFLKQQEELHGELFLDAPKTPTPSAGIAGGSVKPVPKPPPAENNSFFPTPQVPVAGGYPNEPWVGLKNLDHFNKAICTCQKCPLGSTRTKFVFGVGNSNADLVLVGEAPGADEDAQGEPFVGRAGQLLNKILEAINFKREEVFICNILKCRPPNNRDPMPEEVASCEPYLWKQLELIRPKLILCLGRIAAQVLLKTNDSLSSMRGKVHDYRGIPLMVTYHPAALLRNPNWKRPAWEDVQQMRKLYNELTASA